VLGHLVNCREAVGERYEQKPGAIRANKLRKRRNRRSVREKHRRGDLIEDSEGGTGDNVTGQDEERLN
jgi:hypothetical protein